MHLENQKKRNDDDEDLANFVRNQYTKPKPKDTGPVLVEVVEEEKKA